MSAGESNDRRPQSPKEDSDVESISTSDMSEEPSHSINELIQALNRNYLQVVQQKCKIYGFDFLVGRPNEEMNARFVWSVASS